MDTPRVDPDIRSSWTLPSTAYHDPALYRRFVDEVLPTCWHWVADRDRLKAPGHVLPVTLLEGSLDEPVVLTRDAEGRAHCLSNVCTHRGALVVEGEGHSRSLRCRYHGRKFGLDGCFLSMPEFEEARDFPGPADDLPTLALEAWGPLQFTSLTPRVPFAEWMDPVRARTDWLPLERAAHHPESSRDYYMAANWALYVDNYLEEFHIPYIHGQSLAGLDYEAYRTEVFSWGNLQFGVGRDGEPAFDLPDGHPDAGERISAWYFWLFPNVMLNFYPWGLSLNVVEPLGPTRTRVRFRSYVWDEARRADGVGGDLHRVEMEDEEVVESVQKGVRSRLYDRGRFSPRREVGTHQFHTLLARVLDLP